VKKHSVEKYKVLDEGDHHFIVQHPGGESFTIAKHALSPELLEEIRGMRVQKMADGGEVPDPTAALTAPILPADAPNATIIPQAPPAPNYLDAPPLPNAPLTKIENALSDPSIVRNAIWPNADGRTPAPATPADPAPPAAAPEAAAPIASVAAPQPGTARAPAASSDPSTSLMRQGFAQEKAGAAGEAKALGDQGKETAKVLDTLASQQKQFQETYNAKLSEYSKERESLEASYRDGKIDPHRYFSNLSTGNRILAGISLFLGGLSGGLSGRGGNVALDIIQKNIDRDIDAQKSDLDKKNSLLRLNMEKTRDLNQAQLLTQNQLLSAAKVQVESAAAKYQGPIAQARAQALIGAINEKQSQNEMSLALYHAKAAFVGGAAGGGDGQGQPLSPYLASDKEIAERVVRTGTDHKGQPLYMLAKSKEAGDKLSEIHNDSATVQENLAQMKQLASVGNALSPQERQKFSNLATQTAPLLMKIGGVNRFNTDEAKLQMQTLGNLSSGTLTGSTQTALDQVNDYVRRARENARSSYLLNYQSPVKPKSFKPGLQ
jgi:hypothetical protein